MATTSNKRSRASAEQLSQMVDFMLNNPGFAGCKFKKQHGKLECDKKWNELSQNLNCLGGAVKDVNQWQAVWKELKKRTTGKLRDRKRQLALTGNKPVTQEALSALERRIVEVIGTDYIEGHGGVEEHIPMEENLQLLLEEAEEIVAANSEVKCDTPCTSKSTPRRGQKRKRVDDDETKKQFLEIANKGDASGVQRFHPCDKQNYGRCYEDVGGRPLRKCCCH